MMPLYCCLLFGFNCALLVIEVGDAAALGGCGLMGGCAGFCRGVCIPTRK